MKLKEILKETSNPEAVLRDASKYGFNEESEIETYGYCEKCDEFYFNHIDCPCQN